MISAPPQIPSYAQGFAPRDGPPANPNRRKGLLGAWHPYLGPTGLTLFDQSGRHKDGTLTNGPTWMVTEMGWAVNFSGGVTEGVVTADLDFPASTSRLSLVCRFLWLGGGVAAWPFLCGKYSDYAIVMKTADRRIRWRITQSDSTQKIAFSPALTFGNWYTTVLVADGDNLYGYLDGELAATPVAYDGTIKDSGTQAFAFGNASALNAGIKGQISHLALYDRPLILDEVREASNDVYALSRLRQQVYPAAVAPPSGHAGPLVNRTPLVSKLQGLCA